MKTLTLTFALLLQLSSVAFAVSFDPPPNDPPERTGGSGTRLEKLGSASTPEQCPKGTEIALPNEEGGVDCYR